MKNFFLTIVVALLCATSLYSNEDKAIKHTILKYNYGIIKAAKSGETDFFSTYMKKEMATKLMLWVKSWQDNNLVMMAQINDLRFSQISYNENNATMTTFENWTYSYVDISKKKLALAPVNIFYEMRYTLQKKGDTWMIIDITHLKEEEFTKPNLHKPSLDKQTPQEESPTSNQQGKIATH